MRAVPEPSVKRSSSEASSTGESPVRPSWVTTIFRTSCTSLFETTPWATSVVEVHSRFNALSFDYEFLAGADGIFSVHFDGESVFTAYQNLLPPGVQSQTVTLGTGYPPGTYSLAFRLDSDGTGGTDVEVSNVRFETPHVSSVPALHGGLAALLAAGLCIAGWTVLKWRRFYLT